MQWQQFFTLDVSIGFQESNFTLKEEDGIVLICVELNGSLQRNVSIQLFTDEISATGIAMNLASIQYLI